MRISHPCAAQVTEWEPTVELESGTVSGKTLVCNRLVDAGIVLLVTILSLEALSLELGVAFGSLIAVGGASSVVVALACQEPLRHLINGLLLAFSDKFEPGDEIMFDDVAGFCTSMGWFDTSVRRGVERSALGNTFRASRGECFSPFSRELFVSSLESARLSTTSREVPLVYSSFGPREIISQMS